MTPTHPETPAWTYWYCIDCGKPYPYIAGLSPGPKTKVRICFGCEIERKRVGRKRKGKEAAV